MSGCLWTLIPFPIVIILYSVVRQPLVALMKLTQEEYHNAHGRCDPARLLHRSRQDGRLFPDDHRQRAARALCRYRLQPRRGGVRRQAQEHQLPLPRSQHDREAVAHVLEHSGMAERPLVHRAADVPHPVHLRRTYHSPDDALPEDESPRRMPRPPRPARP